MFIASRVFEKNYKSILMTWIIPEKNLYDLGSSKIFSKRSNIWHKKNLKMVLENKIFEKFYKNPRLS